MKPITLLSTILVLFVLSNTADAAAPQDKLIRHSFHSDATGKQREYFVYLPVGYEEKQDKRWPLILFLHGHGERGNGLDELDYVLKHGPLMEAWIQKRPLPFIIISPQLPLFGEHEAIKEREANPPKRLQGSAVPARNYGFKSDLPIQRTNAENFPGGPYEKFEPYPQRDTLPKGWPLIRGELISMVDTVLKKYRADPERVYLTGLSMGGFGTFEMAAQYPDRWAAVAPIVGTGKLDDTKTLAKAKLPIWMFGAGKDRIIKPHWLYKMARALEEAGHPEFRFTVHEDMDHDVWKRVYEGEDLYRWLLRFRRDNRP